MLRTVCCCSFVCVLIACPVRAQDSAADTTHVLPGITVVDRREPFYGNDAAAFLTRIPSSRLEASAGRSVADALGNHGGLFMRQYGAGGIGGVSIRGTSPSQSAVVLDGLPLSSPQLGQVDLSLLPTFMLSGVEVLHGGASSLAGAGAMGGVISLRSLDTAGGRSARVRTVVGAWGERSLSGKVVVGDGRVKAVVAGELSRRDGDFSYTDRASFPTARRVRNNADGASDNLMARIVVARARATLEVAGWIMKADRGLPGVAGSGSSGERQEDGLRRIWIRYGTGGTTLTASSQRSVLGYVNPSLDVDDLGRTVSHAIGLRRRQSWASGVSADLGLDVSMQSASHPSLEADADQRSAEAFVSGSLPLGRLNVLPSVRGVWVARTGASVGQVSPAVRLRLEPAAGKPVYVWSGVSTSFRAPTFNDLYWRSAGATGEPDLRPERGFSLDIGADMESGPVALRLAAFYQSIRDRITWLVADGSVWRPENVGRVGTVGLESAASGSMTLADRLTMNLSARYTLTSARDRTDASSASFGQPLRYVPMHMLHTDYSLQWGSFEIGASISFTSRRYLTTDGTEWLPPYSVVGGHVSTRLETGSAHLGIALYLENLAGVEYQVMSGYPMPPRHARLQLTLTTK